MKLSIKNMVCNRCIMVVKDELEKVGLNPTRVELGVAEIEETLSEHKKEIVNKRLKKLGFELIDDKRSRLIERIKTLIIERVHHNSEKLRTNVSDYLAAHISLEYNYLSNLFSEAEGTTIEKFYIAQKLERVKELLVYDELSLSEIADQLGYSSASYLSAQFKKVLGMSPSQFRNSSVSRRKAIDKL